MPTPPSNDIARRLEEISTLLKMIIAMRDEGSREDVLRDLHTAVSKLADVPTDDNHSTKSRLVRMTMGMISRLELGPYTKDVEDEIELLFDIVQYIIHPVIAYRLQMPSFTDLNGRPIMTTYPLALDKVATFTITELNTVTGAFDPVDPTDQFTLVNTDAVNLNAVIGVDAAGAPALVVNWLHTVTPLLTGVSVTISDSLGNTPDPQLFDMVQPAALPDQIGLDLTNVSLVDQPVPV